MDEILIRRAIEWRHSNFLTNTFTPTKFSHRNIASVLPGSVRTYGEGGRGDGKY